MREHHEAWQGRAETSCKIAEMRLSIAIINSDKSPGTKEHRRTLMFRAHVFPPGAPLRRGGVLLCCFELQLVPKRL